MTTTSRVEERAYSSVNQRVLELVPPGSSAILDVGCGGGELGGALKFRRRATLVTGVTRSKTEAASARRVLDNVLVIDLDNQPIPDVGPFDCIVCSHVLEHLRQPGRVLRQLKDVLAPQGSLVVAVPNVLHWRQRVLFVKGEFRYTTGGLMDDTHVVFFDWKTARELVENAGFEIEYMVSDGSFPGSRMLGPLGKRMSHVALKLSPGLFGWQFVIFARPSA